MTARRLAAILAADVVGYSRLMGEDEAGTAKIVRTRREAATPIVGSFGGRLVKTTGDGVLLEFPSVVAAVECGIAIQKMMAERNAALPEAKRILYRVGVNLGDVLIEGDDILGDGVNVAARLEAICEPGGVCVSGSAYEHVQGRVAVDFADLGEQRLKNIAKPVRAYALSPEAIAAAKVEPAEASASPERRETPGLPEPFAPKKRAAFAPLALALAALLIVAGGAWWLLDANRPASVATKAPQSASGAPARSIVVLPLSNLSGDAGQNYLVDALTDELTTAISRLPDTFVIARNTAFTFKDRPADVKTIGKDLGVKYVLEGSVQPTPTRIRVNAQLIDAESGAHLWAESFDEDRAGLLQMEDDIVTRLARTLDFKMTDVEAAAARRLRPSNLSAQDLALQCLARYNDNHADAQDPAKHPEIFEFCDQALRLDPGNTLALSLLTHRLAALVIRGVDMTAEAGRLDDLVGKALAVNPNDGNARFAKGFLAFTAHARGDEAAVEFERAIAENPSEIDAYAYLGTIYINMGEAEKAIAVFDKAIRLSPHDPSVAKMLRWKADALDFLGRYAEASVFGAQALALAPDDPQILRKQAATLANLGRDAEARELYQRYAALMGGKLVTVAQYRTYLNSFGGADIPSVAAFREHVLDGLRKAGMPAE
jgi:TolB-like protein/class 3 adenylate cyclase/Flp pilus assembly protein TadD